MITDKWYKDKLTQVESIRKLVPELHPLVWHRTLENTNSLEALFEVTQELKIIKYPIVWDYNAQTWVHTEDLLQAVNISKLDKN